MRFSDNASRELAHELFGRTHIAGVWTSECHRQSEALYVAYGKVCPPFSRGLQKSEVGSDAIDDKQCFSVMAGFGKACEVFDDTVSVRLLDDDAGYSPVLHLFLQVLMRSYAFSGLYRFECYSVEVCISFKYTDDVFGKRIRIQYGVSFLGIVESHHHGFRCGSCPFVHRGIGNVHACEFCDHTLELEDIMKCSL